MFMLFPKFSERRAGAPGAWLRRSFDGEAFLAAGSLRLGTGGAVLGRGTNKASVEGIVAAGIGGAAPSRADLRLDVLMDAA